MRSLFLSQRFFGVMASLIIIFFLGFGLEFLFPIAQVMLMLFIAVFAIDLWLMYKTNKPLVIDRIIPELLSLADNNEIKLRLKNNYPFNIQVIIIDELPYQLQERDFEIVESIEAYNNLDLSYHIFPDERGEYHFGIVNVYAMGFIGLVKRRIKGGVRMIGKVYPSVVQMKNLELLALSRISTLEGVKKMRKIGHNYEFEQIKTYSYGDDIRSINWKSTGKRHSLMVNQYQDERAQQVYMVLDKSRSMELRFNEVRYLDYAINSALVMANIALKKYDKAGLITFSDKIGASIKAERSKLQLRRILEQLYREKPSEREADYDLLMRITRKMLYGRSLLLLYTNFESEYSLDRIIPYLKRLNKIHLLVVIFFEDSEIAGFATESRQNTNQIYQQVLAGTYLTNKRKMKARLQKLSIQTILTTPEKLSVDTLNKYLELKARGLI
jgi:uncharacterized protein (DUF58 family)